MLVRAVLLAPRQLHLRSRCGTLKSAIEQATGWSFRGREACAALQAPLPPTSSHRSHHRGDLAANREPRALGLPVGRASMFPHAHTPTHSLAHMFVWARASRSTQPAGHAEGGRAHRTAHTPDRGRRGHAWRPPLGEREAATRWKRLRPRGEVVGTLVSSKAGGLGTTTKSESTGSCPGSD